MRNISSSAGAVCALTFVLAAAGCGRPPAPQVQNRQETTTLEKPPLNDPKAEALKTLPPPERRPERRPEPPERPAPAAPKGPTYFQKTAAACESGEIPASPAPRNGLEMAAAWGAVAWEDRTLCRQISVKKTGRTLMYLATGGGPKGKGAASLPAPIVLADKGAVRMSAFNNSDVPVKVGVAFWTMPGGVYYESTPQDVPTGKWQELSFDLNAATYKCEASKWQFNASLPKERRINQIAVLLHHGGKTCRVLVDGLIVDRVTLRERLRDRPAEQKPEKPDKADKPEKADKAEKPDKPEKPDKAAEPAKPEDAGKPDAPAKGVEPEEKEADAAE